MVVEPEWSTGDPSNSICKIAEEMDVEEVILVSQGKGALERFFLGSISLSVLENCSRPVTLHKGINPPEEE